MAGFRGRLQRPESPEGSGGTGAPAAQKSLCWLRLDPSANSAYWVSGLARAGDPLAVPGPGSGTATWSPGKSLGPCGPAFLLEQQLWGVELVWSGLPA